MQVDNATFLRAIFGGQARRAHVTSFDMDPGNIPNEQRGLAWGGHSFMARQMRGKNQYFTISLFRADEDGKSRRRKNLFEATYCIVLDDVREKLSEVKARWLPHPSWILETSPGSEQWGYILETPETDRLRVENLQDGLVSNGLSPDGTDPGMKGVTRYVRLPEGYNTKANKFLFGKPYKCTMLRWNPNNRTTLEALAKPFGIDLNAPRRDTAIDGATDVPDHPLLHIPEALSVKSILSDGRFDVTCPWVMGHTDALDDGAAVFTNKDGTIGFKCHHGSCQGRTGKHLLEHIESFRPGFTKNFDTWRVMRGFGNLVEAEAPEPEYVRPAPNFLEDVKPSAPATVEPESNEPIQEAIDALRREHPTSREAKDLVSKILYLAESLPTLDQVHLHDEVMDAMGWTKTQFDRIFKGLRSEWYLGDKKRKEFYENVLFVKELNQFYDFTTRTFMTVEGFTNANLHEDPDVRKTALQDGFVQKVDRLDYVPGKDRVFEERGIVFGNMYYGDNHPQGIEGDAGPWLRHFDVLGWGPYREHILKFMAFTILHPEIKINHMIIMGSREGSGKDFLLHPLLYAMGEDAKVIEGDALTENYTGYLNGVKYLHVNEVELGDRREAMAIANKLKPIASAPPEMLRVRELFTKPFWVRNLVNGTMTTNSRLPLRLQETRRFFALWSDLQIRGADGNVTPEWSHYWQTMWEWMEKGGRDYCVWYLRNCVDLSDFRPGAPPPVTDFLREIQDESTHPIQKTIREFIEYRYGVFAADLVTARDMANTLKAGNLVAPDSMYADADDFSMHRVTSHLRDMGIPRVVAKNRYSTARLYLVRNAERYKEVPPSQLYEMYLSQHEKIRENNSSKIVDIKKTV